MKLQFETRISFKKIEGSAIIISRSFALSRVSRALYTSASPKASVCDAARADSYYFERDFKSKSLKLLATDLHAYVI